MSTDLTDPVDPPIEGGPPREGITIAQQLTLPCVLSFNANDPTGAGGLAADIAAMGSA